jgi:glycosyltransferase involved in cell wall biosynthesis
MPENPLISVITVVFNNEKHIEQSIQSVINQTCRDFEYIVIDGKSTDKTLDIIKKYGKDVDMLICEADEGLYFAMNKGILKSSGKYVYFLNSDDYFFDSDVLKDVSEFLKTVEPDIVIGLTDVLFQNPNYLKEEKIKFSRKNLRNGIQPMHSGSFFNRNLIFELGLFDTKYKSAADFDMFCKAYVKNVSFGNINRKIAVFRDGGYSSTTNTGRFEGAEIIKKYFGRFWYFRFYIIEKLKVPLKKILKKTGLYPFFLKFYKQKVEKR